MIAALNLNPLDLLTQAFAFSLEKMVLVFEHVWILSAIGAFGLAIIVLTLVLRSILFPVFAWQMRTMRKSQAGMAKLAPELQELRKRYKGQAQKLNQEMQKLYREHGISPTAPMKGCLPMALQSVIIFPLYWAIQNASKNLQGGLGFLWIPNVTQTAHEACCLISKTSGGTEYFRGWIDGLFQHPTLLLLPVVAGVATLVQSRMMLIPPPANASAQQQSMQNMSNQMTLFMPVMIVWMSLQFAQGIAIYWVTQSLYMIVQQHYLVGWGAIHMPSWVPGAHRVTDLTHEDHRRRRLSQAAARASESGLMANMETPRNRND